jgi:hypothetical protein
MIRMLTLLAVAGAAVPTMPALAAADHGFTIANTNARASIDRIWYMQAGSGQPYQEISLNYAIGPNHKSDFTVPPSDYCLYDVRIKFSDGTQVDTPNVNVCRGTTITAS